ncbi:MAG: DUF2878 domain-containing protein [Proteobacteria bacterium]|nr:DUF2878 domain-containing protein [Pseudomonadota bacterium]
MRIAINFIAFQIGWFACVLGAGHDFFWLGPLTVAGVFFIHLFLNGNIIQESILGLIICCIGFSVDTFLTAFNVYTPMPHYFAHPISPPWLIFLWLNFATLVNVSLTWLQNKRILSALLGGIGGASAYYGGDALGALHFIEPVYPHIILTGIIWAGLTPFFLSLAIFLKRL